MKAWLPYSLWDLRGIESWLNELAAKGFALEQCPDFWSIGRFTFRPSEEVKHARYRLDPVGSSDALRERAANYREMGWRFVDRLGNLYAIYRCDDPEAPELYTDSESLGWAMKKLIRRQWIALALCLFWAGWLMRDEIVRLFTAPELLPLPLILNSDVLIPAYLFLILAIGVQVISTLRRTVRFTRLRRRLVQGEYPAPQRRTYPQLRENLGALAVLVFIVVVVILLLNRAQDTRRLSDRSEWDFPYVTLAEILPEGTQLQEVGPQEMLRYNTFSHSYLAPEQYDTAQSGSARLPDGTHRQVWLSLDYIQARSPAIARWVFAGEAAQWRQSMEAYRKNWEENTVYIHSDQPAFVFLTEEEHSYSGLDRLICFSFQYSDEDYPRACYVGQLGDQVFLLSVRGPDLEKPLSLLVERLEEQS